jgi:hypothetical protein
MPHPDRFLDWTLHPFWTRLDRSLTGGDAPGLLMFKDAVAAAATRSTSPARTPLAAAR